MTPKCQSFNQAFTGFLCLRVSGAWIRSVSKWDPHRICNC